MYTYVYAKKTNTSYVDVIGHIINLNEKWRW